MCRVQIALESMLEEAQFASPREPEMQRKSNFLSRFSPSVERSEIGPNLFGADRRMG
jgi:hypothetical protein